MEAQLVRYLANESNTAAPLTDTAVYVGVIEWSSDSGEEPELTLARSLGAVARWFRDVVSKKILDDDQPAPPAANCSDQELVDWMDEWRDATTDAWLTIYRRELPA